MPDLDKCSLDELWALTSDVMRLQLRNTKTMDTKAARAAASARVAASHGVSVAELEKALARYRKEKAAERRRNPAQSADGVTSGDSTTNTYQRAAAQFDMLPSDAVLAFFTGRPASVYSNARSRARAAGYDFQPADAGFWRVTQRPPPATLSADLSVSVLGLFDYMPAGSVEPAATEN